MHLVRLAPLAELFELETVLELFLVLGGVVVHAMALRAFKFYEIVL